MLKESVIDNIICENIDKFIINEIVTSDKRQNKWQVSQANKALNTLYDVCVKAGDDELWAAYEALKNAVNVFSAKKMDNLTQSPYNETKPTDEKEYTPISPGGWDIQPYMAQGGEEEMQSTPTENYGLDEEMPSIIVEKTMRSDGYCPKLTEYFNNLKPTESMQLFSSSDKLDEKYDDYAVINVGKFFNLMYDGGGENHIYSDFWFTTPPEIDKHNQDIVHIDCGGEIKGVFLSWFAGKDPVSGGDYKDISDEQVNEYLKMMIS